MTRPLGAPHPLPSRTRRARIAVARDVRRRRRRRRVHPSRRQGAHHRAATARCAPSGCIRSRTPRCRRRRGARRRRARELIAAASTSSSCASRASSSSSTSVRLRLDLDNYASFSHLLSLFRAAGIGSLHLHSATDRAKDWLRFLALLLRAVAAIRRPTRFQQLTEKLEAAGSSPSFELGEPMRAGDGRRVAPEGEGGREEDVRAVGRRSRRT